MEAAHPHCREYVLPDFILSLFHLTSSHTSGSESSSFYMPVPNAWTWHPCSLDDDHDDDHDDDDDDTEHLLLATLCWGTYKYNSSQQPNAWGIILIKLRRKLRPGVVM